MDFKAKTVAIICAIILLSSIGITLVSASLVTSNTIHITVTAPPTSPTPTPPSYSAVLLLNGTSSDTYTGTIHPGDTLLLTAVTSSSAIGKTVTFYNNLNYPIGTGNVNSNCLATLFWVVPALTTANPDVYALRVEVN